MKMRDEKDSNERLDDFSDYMRRRLEDHRLPINAADWEELETRIGRKSMPWGWWWYGGLVAAAILALVVWLLPVPEEYPEKGHVLSEERVRPLQEKHVPVSDEAPVPARLNRSVVIAQAAIKVSALPESFPEVSVDEADTIIDIEAVPVDVPAGQKGETGPEPDGHPVFMARDMHELAPRKKEGKRNKWQVSATVGTSGNLSSPLGFIGDTSDSPTSPGPGNDPGDKDTEDEDDTNKPGNGGGSNLRSSSLRSSTDDLGPFDHSFESYPEVSHSLPISFGFTARKSLNRYIGIESGLIYTYLSSTFRQTGTYRTEVRSRLHYLGIPVNLVVNLWDHPRWNVYLSGGLMMEKGIQAVYTEHKFGKEIVFNRTVKEGIDGLQWSVNASVGVGYRVYRDWSLYLEPRFSYYFDSDQPASIRTNKPLGFGLNAGVRFAF